MHEAKTREFPRRSDAEVSLESRMLGNQHVRFGKGEVQTCPRPEYGNGECSFQSLLSALLETG